MVRIQLAYTKLKDEFEKVQKKKKCPVENCNGMGNTDSNRTRHNSFKHCPMAFEINKVSFAIYITLIIKIYKNKNFKLKTGQSNILESNYNEIINLKDQINEKVCIYLNRSIISKYKKIIF